MNKNRALVCLGRLLQYWRAVAVPTLQQGHLCQYHPDVYPQGSSKHSFHCMVLIALTLAPSGVPPLCFHLHVYSLLYPPTAFYFFPLFSCLILKVLGSKSSLLSFYWKEKKILKTGGARKPIAEKWCVGTDLRIPTPENPSSSSESVWTWKRWNSARVTILGSHRVLRHLWIVGSDFVKCCGKLWAPFMSRGGARQCLRWQSQMLEERRLESGWACACPRMAFPCSVLASVDSYQVILVKLRKRLWKVFPLCWWASKGCCACANTKGWKRAHPLPSAERDSVTAQGV